MAVDDVFKRLSSHIVKGVMIHGQLADYYGFLGLHGYQKAHEYHMEEEMRSMLKLHWYYIAYQNKLIQEEAVENPNVIPASWYGIKRQDVSSKEKRDAVRDAMEKWVEWESETLLLYESMYNELMKAGEVAAAKEVGSLVKDVSKELKWAQKKSLDLASVEYSMEYIIGEQDFYYQWHKKRM